MGKRICQRTVPNVLVISLGLGLGLITEISIIPKVIEQSDAEWFWYLCGIFTLCCFAMWMWCWFVTILGDPGRIRNDLQRRGVLHLVERGDIPNALRHLPICPKCRLPKPDGAYHCDICGDCFLRYDHHCGVTGQCVADKNFKPFILNFFYGGVYGLSMVIPSLVRVIRLGKGDTPVLPLVTLIYGGLLGLFLIGFGFSFLCSAAKETSVYDKITKRATRKMKLGKFCSSFGVTFWDMVLPIQNTSTHLAWPGIDWENPDVMPL